MLWSTQSEFVFDRRSQNIKIVDAWNENKVENTFSLNTYIKM